MSAPAPLLASSCKKTAEAEKLIEQGKFTAALPVAKAGVAECEAAHVMGARPYVTLGKVYNELKQYDLAAKNYEQAIKQEPKLGLAYFSLGGIYAQQGKYDDSIRTIEKSLKLALTNWEKAKAYFNLGYAYFSIAADKEDTADRRSEAWFKKSRELDPTIAENYYYLGVLQELSYKNFGSAKPLYKRSCDLGFKTGCEWYQGLADHPKTGNAGGASAAEPV